MALNAQAHGVGVEYGAHPSEMLDRCQPLYKARSVAALHDWLNRHG